MKIIDLLNKIAYGEKVPEKIRFMDVEYYYFKPTGNYWNDEIDDGLMARIDGINFNDEVEIIEEDNKIKYEKIKTLTCNAYDYEKQTINSLIQNQRKIIDEINKLKKANKL